MTITYQPGQYFDLKLGWLTEKPKVEFSSNIPDFVKEGTLDDSMAYIMDDKLQALLDRFAAERQARLEKGTLQLQEVSETVEAPYAGSAEYPSYSYDAAGAGFISTGYSIRTNVDLHTSYFLSTAVQNYEVQRSSIMDMKNRGYCDEAVNMLLGALDKKFLSHANQGLSQQLQWRGYSENEAEAYCLQFNKQYLKARGGFGSAEDWARKALASMGMSDYDVDFGKPGHYGSMSKSPQLKWLVSKGVDIDQFFKVKQGLDAWLQEQYRNEPKPLGSGVAVGNLTVTPAKSRRTLTTTEM